MTFKLFIRLADREDCDQPLPFDFVESLEWKTLEELLCAYYEDVTQNLSLRLDVRYWDEEDFVNLSSQAELEEAVRIAEEKSYLQLYVRLLDVEADTVADVSDHTAGEEPVGKTSQKEGPESNRETVQDCIPSETPETLHSVTDTSNRPLADDTPESSIAAHFEERSMSERSAESSSDLSSTDNMLKIQSPLDTASAQQDTSNSVTAMEVQKYQQAMMNAAAAQDKQRQIHQLVWLQEMDEGGVSYDEGIAEEGNEESNAHTMLPGALSGANVIAIEMPEVEHQGTETAEPAEMAETGEVSTRSSRDAETGFWVQAEQRAVKEGGRRFTAPTIGTGEQQAPYDLSVKKHERKSSHAEKVQKKKKKRVIDSSSEDRPQHSNAHQTTTKREKGKSSTSTTTTSSLLDTPSEDLSSETVQPRKHERRSSKSDGTQKKKKNSDPLTEDAFVRYMTKFENLLKKSVAKEIAKKTARTVVKNMSKPGEGSEGHDSQPAPVLPHRSGFVHEDIICDCCDREIVGTRYICGNCPNYDLCEECENIQPSFHDRTHVFIKLRRPCLKAGTRHGVRKPLLKRIVYEHAEEERIVDPGRVQVIMDRIKAQGDQFERRMSRNNNSSKEDGAEGNSQEEETNEEEQEECQLPHSAECTGETTCEHIVQSAENNFVFTNYSPLVTIDEDPSTCVSGNRSDADKHVPSAVEALREMLGITGRTEKYHIGQDLQASFFGDNDITFKPLADCSLFPVMSPVVVKEEAQAVPLEVLDDDDFDSISELTDDGYVMCHTTEDDMVTSSPLCLLQSAQPLQDTPETVLASPQASVADQESVDEPGLRAESPFSIAGSEHEFQKEVLERAPDGFSSFGSLSEDSSSEEDFCVIVPDCFDITKPLDERSLAMLAIEEQKKQHHGKDGQVTENDTNGTHKYMDEMLAEILAVPAAGVRSQYSSCQSQVERHEIVDEMSAAKKIVTFSIQEEDCAHDESASAEEEESAPVLVDAPAEKEPTRANTKTARASEVDETDGSANTEQAVSELEVCEMDELANTEQAVSEVEVKEMGEPANTEQAVSEVEVKEMGEPANTEQAVSEVEVKEMGEPANTEQAVSEVEVKEMGEPANTEQAVSELEASEMDEPATTEQAVFDLEASELDEPANTEQAVSEVEDPSQQHSSAGQDSAECEDETDVKHPTCSDEEGAAAASDSISDPNQQLNQMVTNTIKKASSGLQQMFQTGKDIFKTWQTGDSYEFKESSYQYKPAEYKLPESTWQPSSKEYVPPKSNFKFVQSEYQLPKSNYSLPKSQVSAGIGFAGDYAGPLQRIREMGYFNNEHTLDLLRKHNGDIQKVVNELLEEVDNDWADKRHGNHM